MAISEVSICNQALSWLGGNRITSLDDESIEAQVCKDNYELLRDSVIEAADWSFALRRFRRTPLASIPDFGFAAEFAIPAEVIRIVGHIYRDENGTGRVSQWAAEDSKILCDESVIYFKAVCVVEDPAKFSPLFSQALAARIAAEISRPLTNKSDKTLWELYSRKVGDAMASDGLQGVNQEIPPGRLISRRSGGY